jgi:hypothetical protein
LAAGAAGTPIRAAAVAIVAVLPGVIPGPPVLTPVALIVAEATTVGELTVVAAIIGVVDIIEAADTTAAASIWALDSEPPTRTVPGTAMVMRPLRLLAATTTNGVTGSRPAATLLLPRIPVLGINSSCLWGQAL